MNTKVSLCVLDSVEIVYLEGNDEVKTELLASMGSWMKSCTNIAEPVLRALNNAFNGKEALRMAALNSVAACRDNSSLFAGVSMHQVLRMTIDHSRLHHWCPPCARLWRWVWRKRHLVPKALQLC